MEADLVDYVARQPIVVIREWLSCPYGGNQPCTAAWGEESFDQAMMWAYRDVDGGEIVNGSSISEMYYLTRVPIVRERLAIAGLRLAATLAMALSSPLSPVGQEQSAIAALALLNLPIREDDSMLSDQ